MDRKKAEIDEEKVAWLRDCKLKELGPMPSGNYENTEYFMSRAKEYELSLEPDDKTRMYKSEPDFTYITPLYFTRWDEIVFAIQHSPKNEK